MPDNSYGIFVWEQKGDHWEMSLIDIQYDEKDNDITGDTGYHLSGGRLQPPNAAANAPRNQ